MMVPSRLGSDSDDVSREKVYPFDQAKVYLRKDGTIGIKHDDPKDSRLSKVGGAIGRFFERSITYDKSKIRSAIVAGKVKLDGISESDICQIFIKLYGKNIPTVSKAGDQPAFLMKQSFFSVLVARPRFPASMTKKEVLDVLDLFEQEKKRNIDSLNLEMLKLKEREYFSHALTSLNLGEMDREFINKIVEFQFLPIDYGKVANLLLERGLSDLAIHLINCVPLCAQEIKSEYLEQMSIERLKLFLEEGCGILEKLSAGFLRANQELVDLSIQKYQLEAVESLRKSGYFLKTAPAVKAFTSSLRKDYKIAERFLRSLNIEDFLIFPEGSFEKAFQEAVYSREHKYIIYQAHTKRWTATTNEADFNFFKRTFTLEGVKADIFHDFLVQAHQWNEARAFAKKAVSRESAALPPVALIQADVLRERIEQMGKEYNTILATWKQESNLLGILGSSYSNLIEVKASLTTLISKQQESLQIQEEIASARLKELLRSKTRMAYFEELVSDWAVLVATREEAHSKLSELIKLKKEDVSDENAMRLANEAIMRAESAYIACQEMRLEVEKEIKAETQRAKREDCTPLFAEYCKAMKLSALIRLKILTASQNLAKIDSKLEEIAAKQKKLELKHLETIRELEPIKKTWEGLKRYKF